jgi:hypothetical protein
LVADYLALLPSDLSDLDKDAHRDIASAILPLARRMLDREPAATDVLVWWPQQKSLAALFPLAKMLFAIPASSADSERSFSSAGLSLGTLRTRMAVEAFRAEHRIRRFVTACADAQTSAGREKRLARVRTLLGRFAEVIADHRGLGEVPQ